MYSQCIDIVRDIAKACENNPEKFREFAEMVKQFHDDLLEDLQKQEPQHEGTLVSSTSATEWSPKRGWYKPADEYRSWKE